MVDEEQDDDDAVDDDEEEDDDDDDGDDCDFDDCGADTDSRRFFLAIVYKWPMRYSSAQSGIGTRYSMIIMVNNEQWCGVMSQ